MPDLTIEAYFTCASNRDWEQKLELTSGREHSVTFGRIFGGKYPYGYQCDCKGYRFGKGRHCRHIKHVVHHSLRCGWDGYSAAKDADGNLVCPKCGAEALPYQVGV